MSVACSPLSSLQSVPYFQEEVLALSAALGYTALMCPMPKPTVTVAPEHLAQLRTLSEKMVQQMARDFADDMKPAHGPPPNLLHRLSALSSGSSHGGWPGAQHMWEASLEGQMTLLSRGISALYQELLRTRQQKQAAAAAAERAKKAQEEAAAQERKRRRAILDSIVERFKEEAAANIGIRTVPIFSGRRGGGGRQAVVTFNYEFKEKIVKELETHLQVTWTSPLFKYCYPYIKDALFYIHRSKVRELQRRIEERKAEEEAKQRLRAERHEALVREKMEELRARPAGGAHA